jgi:hypothetical protein
MDEPKKSTPSAADSSSEAHTGIPKAGNVTPGTTPNAADLTENELEDVVGGLTASTIAGGTGGGSVTLFGGTTRAGSGGGSLRG